MPIAFTFYPDQGVFVSRWMGELSDVEMLLAYKRLLADEAFTPGLNEIVDMRETNLSSVTAKGMLHLVEMAKYSLAGKCRRFKTAIVAPEDLSFDMSNLYEAQAFDLPEDIRVCRQFDKALEWLGIENLTPK